MFSLSLLMFIFVLNLFIFILPHLFSIPLLSYPGTKVPPPYWGPSRGLSATYGFQGPGGGASGCPRWRDHPWGCDVSCHVPQSVPGVQGVYLWVTIWWHEHDRFSWQKSVVFFFFNHSKAQQSAVRTTVTNGPCVPIILCASLAYTDLLVEWKWRAPQVVWGNQVKCLWNCGCSSEF